MCFKRVSKDELLVEADGIKVDVCLDCARVEEMMMRIAAI
jgi:ribosome-binding protein aMBF1 (putative translation factor)